MKEQLDEMKNKTFLRSSIVMLCAAFLLALWSVRANVAAQPAATPAATENAILTHVDVPTVNWQDVSSYKKAMKQSHAADVDQFVDANRYVINATLSFPGDAVIQGGERVRYTNHSSDTLNNIVFRLYPNAPALDGHMDVANVTVNGQAAQPSLSDDNSVMSVPLAQPLAPNQAAELTMDFDVIMRKDLNVAYGRFGYLENVVSGTAWYPTLSVYEQGSGWWHSLPDPNGDPAYTETGLYDVHLTVPAGVTAVMSGKEIETSTNGDDSITYHGVTGPMRDHAFMASQRYTITPIDVDGTRINIVHYKDSGTPSSSATDGTTSAIKYVTQAFDTYSKTFGEYPFAEYNVVENPTPTGVEFPGLTQIAEQAWSTNARFLEILIAHETGHQWFYSLVGNNQVEHPWLDESITSYVEIVYTRAVYKSDTATNNYINHFKAEYTAYLALGKDLPLDLPVYDYSGMAYGAIVYAKGPLFFVMLDQQLGIDTVYKALSTYFKSYEYKVATTPDVEKTFEDVTGKDLSAEFQKWVTGTNQSPTEAATQMPMALGSW